MSIWRKVYLWSAGSLLLLNIVDAVTTINALSAGKAQEGNPLMAFITVNPVVFLLLKIGISLGFVWLLWDLNKKLQNPSYVSKNYATIVFAAVLSLVIVIIYALVQWNNAGFFL